MSQTLQAIPARKGVAHRLRAGSLVKIINTHGSQVVDCWAFVLPDTQEFMSMEHSRAEISRITPRIGDSLFTNRRRPILTLIEDTSPGVHDTTLAACDVYRYQRLGAKGYHDNCADNLVSAMKAADVFLPAVPCPFNIWENSRVQPDFTQTIEPPLSKPGDYVILRAELDIVIVFSACPQDMLPCNGADCQPKDAHFVAF
ncbi:aminomethyltransferase [Rhizobium leguminosarum bv. trifolii]|uniref:DUF1989 domain-containing protein n=1 Tax=Rhizobium leguminosarum TaxID=384 RepID=UPI000E2F677F|nr:urea carboxylase-associated family protein [Rhizobium leguminosarum]RFB86095.1 aminomethyltransferase [Rhizobium leguminosarum bv. trifolii]